LGVAAANLPAPSKEDANAALARVNAALTGDLATARRQWAEATAAAEKMQTQIAELTKQRDVERATAAEVERRNQIHLWQARMLATGVLLYLIAAGLTAAGVFMSLPALYRTAIAPAAFATLALFAAYEAGTTAFAWLAWGTLAGAVGSLIFAGWQAYRQAATVKTQASGFGNLVKVITNFEQDAKSETDKLWDWAGNLLSDAEVAAAKALSAVFGYADAPSTSTPTPSEEK
jgi:hypothetical protein